MANQSGGKLKEPAAPKGATASPERTGEQVVRAACFRCHETGLNGAPKIGDRAAWSPRVSQGVDAVTRSAISGHGGMPARGGLADLTDREVTSAIMYMFSRAGAEAAQAGPGKSAEATAK
jgi:cytochrome c5